ncbi:MAG: ribonuclease VapC [Methanobrevibacter sp.]|jgi:UPF0271 protein|nr:ribonuclease VapC [Candidatus Methanoflexus mossambicus]
MKTKNIKFNKNNTSNTSNTNISYIIDASGFINGFKPISDNNFTVPEITEEIKDLKSKLTFEEAINNEKIAIVDVKEEYKNKLKESISVSGDNLRLSIPDINLLSLALEFKLENKNPIVITDDYTIQNTLKILNIPFKSILTEGINQIYNWKNICKGCKKEYPNDYPYNDCEICGSDIVKKRIKKN